MRLSGNLVVPAFMGGTEELLTTVVNDIEGLAPREKVLRPVRVNNRLCKRQRWASHQLGLQLLLDGPVHKCIWEWQPRPPAMNGLG